MSRKRIWLLASTVACVTVVACTWAVYAAAGGSDDGRASGIAEQNAPAASCNGKSSKQAYANHGDQNSTASQTFVNLPGATVPIVVSSKGGAKCVSVVFTSMAFAPSGGLLMVRALLDGNQGDPGEVQFEGNSGTFATSQAMTFDFPAVAPGAHTVQIQFRSFSGSSVFLHRGTTLVHFA
jgi:hypothetical protein